MQGKHLFEYAVIRVVPRVEREEFLNVGIVVFCAKQKFLRVLFHIDEARLTAFSPSLEVTELKDRLSAFESICRGGKEGGAIGQLPMASRFRWLTANRSTIVQTSAVHSGFCDASEGTLERLLGQLVL